MFLADQEVRNKIRRQTVSLYLGQVYLNGRITFPFGVHSSISYSNNVYSYSV